MVIHLIKRLLVLILLFITLFIEPAIASRLPIASDTSIIIAKTNSINSINEIDLTPRQRQLMQAIRQRRNHELSKVLEPSQQTKLLHYLHTGDSLNQGIDKLKLSAEQRDMIKAIGQLYDLKMNALVSKF